MSIEVTYLISFVFGIAGFVSVIYNLFRSRKNDLKQDTNTNANIAFELKALQTSLTEFKVEIKSSMEQSSKMAQENHDKLTKLELKLETAFIRIDELREMVRK